MLAAQLLTVIKWVSSSPSLGLSCFMCTNGTDRLKYFQGPSGCKLLRPKNLDGSVSPNIQRQCFMGAHDILNRQKELLGIFCPFVNVFKTEVQRGPRGINSQAVVGLLGTVAGDTGLFSGHIKWMTSSPGV